MSAEPITSPWVASEIARRAAGQADDDYHVRLGQALAGAGAWMPEQCAAFGRELSPEATAYVHFHFAPLLERNPHLRAALAMDPQQLDELIASHRLDWERAA